MRRLKIKNFVAGRWVRTIKKDQDGNFLTCKTRWALKGFQDRQKDTQQTDSPAANRSGFRCTVCRELPLGSVSHGLEDSLLQGEAYDETRNITRADRCIHILYGDKMSSKDSSLSKSKKTPTFRRTSTSPDPVQEALGMLLDPVAQKPPACRRVLWMRLYLSYLTLKLFIV